MVHRGPSAALLVLVVAAALSACGSGEGGAPSGSPAPDPGTTAKVDNVVGTLDRAGVRASCVPGEPCDPAPLAALLVFTSADGKQVRVPVSGPGAFRATLSPGDYVVTPAPQLPGLTVTPGRLTVPETGVVHPALALVSGR